MLLSLPSAQFYDDTLRVCAGPAVVNTPLARFAQLPRAWPLLFRHCESDDISIDEGSSWFNRGELDEVADIIRALLEPDQPHGPVAPSEISVIAPFREQVWRARTLLRGRGLDQVDVGTVEALQGGENRIVILSAVRSRARFVAEDLEKSMGLIQQPRRFNVATTRAKELMIVRSLRSNLPDPSDRR